MHLRNVACIEKCSLQATWAMMWLLMLFPLKSPQLRNNPPFLSQAKRGCKTITNVCFAIGAVYQKRSCILYIILILTVGRWRGNKNQSLHFMAYLLGKGKAERAGTSQRSHWGILRSSSISTINIIINFWLNRCLLVVGGLSIQWWSGNWASVKGKQDVSSVGKSRDHETSV